MDEEKVEKLTLVRSGRTGRKYLVDSGELAAGKLPCEELLETLPEKESVVALDELRSARLVCDYDFSYFVGNTLAFVIRADCSGWWYAAEVCQSLEVLNFGPPDPDDGDYPDPEEEN